MSEHPILKVVDYLLAHVAADFSDVREELDGWYTLLLDTSVDYEIFAGSQAVRDVTPVWHSVTGKIRARFSLPDPVPPAPVRPHTSNDYLCQQWAAGIYWYWRVSFAPDADSTRIFIGEGRVSTLETAQSRCRRAVAKHQRGTRS